MLSNKDIASADRLIFALDVPTLSEARSFVERLGDSVTFYKLGLELFMAGNYFEFARELVAANKKVFVDLKFFDVPETVGRAVRQLTTVGATFATVHGNDQMLEAACREKNGTKILAVTVLTSLDDADLKELGFEVDVKTLVLSRARRALEIGCDGVISSGQEAADLRQHHGDQFVIVVPGVRPVHNDEVQQQDQKRIATVREAFLNGADYIVVGRQIRDSSDPVATAKELQAEIAELFQR